MRKTSELPKTLKTLLLSLAVSDLGLGLVQPLHVVTMVSCTPEKAPLEDTQNALSKIFQFLYRSFLFASFLGVSALMADRFLAVHLHLRYRELVTYQRVVAVVITLWILSALLPLMDFLPLEIVKTVIEAVTGVCCFICTTIFCCKIHFAVRRHTNHIQALQTLQNNEMAVNFAKTRKSGLCTFYVFLFCYLPQYCAFILGFFFINGPNSMFEIFFMCTTTLAHLNSSLNPLIYCWNMRHIRKSILCILRNAFTRQN